MPILLRFATERDPLTDILKALVQIDPEGKRCVPARQLGPPVRR